MNFNDKVVLVTGASSGIGAATAVYFASLGAKLSLFDRDEDNLKKTVDDCRRENSRTDPFYVIGDLTKTEDLENVVERTVDNFGRLDVLINVAGIASKESLEDLSFERYDKTMNTNVRGTMWLTKMAMPHLIKSKGNVVNVSSGASLRPGIGFLAYRMSKATLDQFTKCVALEVASKQVRVNSVNPGNVVTNILNDFNWGSDAVASFWEQAGKYHPLGGIIKATKIASVLAFLASDLASNITGVLLPVDGGSSLAPPQ